jgi:hypothetical protein
MIMINMQGMNPVIYWYHNTGIQLNNAIKTTSGSGNIGDHSDN